MLQSISLVGANAYSQHMSHVYHVISSCMEGEIEDSMVCAGECGSNDHDTCQVQSQKYKHQTLLSRAFGKNKGCSVRRSHPTFIYIVGYGCLLLQESIADHYMYRWNYVALLCCCFTCRATVAVRWP